LKKTAKVFWSGNSQAVRIPKEFLIQTSEVEIRRRGDTIVLRPQARSWSTLLKSLEMFTPDFMESRRKQPRLDKRPSVFR
jgi:antitoxin VapB